MRALEPVAEHPWFSGALLTLLAGFVWLVADHTVALVMLLLGWALIGGTGFLKMISRRSNAVYVRAVYRKANDRRELRDDETAYTFVWPFDEPPVVGSWVTLPARGRVRRGVIVGPGSSADYAGNILPVRSVLADRALVAAPETSHLPPVELDLPAQEPWGELVNKAEVAYPHRHITELVTACGLRGIDLPPEPICVDIRDAVLAPTADERYPAVMIDGMWVGNLLRTTTELSAELRRLADQGLGLKVGLTLSASDGSEMSDPRLTVRFPKPDEVAAPEGLPEGEFVLLPRGKRLHILGETDHAEALVGLLDGSGQRRVAAELFLLDEAAQRARKPTVGVRIGGKPVGWLGPASGAHFVPIIEACASRGLAVCCRALVLGNHLKSDVVLESARAGELSEDWILHNVYRR
ncbi:hypothetical protein [Tessaracoccus sp. OH4464_COT-324]|uniref:hypothetical protein n=1 Tax=Tessaracoccus sp. OH4464_COT-324 TaxID=2491059 RepID=UPI000F63E339|nr:hypothetical protein [Tessaracoccus sp. OH4464_COT-324]